MSDHLLQVVRCRRAGLIALLAVLVSAGLALTTTSLASAAPPVKATIGVTKWYSPSIVDPFSTTEPPQPAQLVVKDVAFSVDFTIDPIGATKLSLTWVNPKTDKVETLGTLDLAANQTFGTIVASGIPIAGNNVDLTISAKSPGVRSKTFSVDVLKTYVSADPTQYTLIGIGGGGGPGIPCSPTPTDQTCGDLILPSSTSVTGASVLLTQGSCDGVCTSFASGSVLEWLAGLGSGVTRTNPVVFIAKCDKSLCGGKGIKSYTVQVQATGATVLTTSQGCTSKGVVDDGLDFCTDYVQSTRDNAGDLYLYVLFYRDAKIIFG